MLSNLKAVLGRFWWFSWLAWLIAKWTFMASTFNMASIYLRDPFVPRGLSLWLAANVLGTLRQLVSTSSAPRLVLKHWRRYVLHQWLQIQIRVSAKTQPNDMSFGLTPFISMSVQFVPGFIFGATGSDRLLMALIVIGRCGLFVCTAPISLRSSLASTTWGTQARGV